MNHFPGRSLTAPVRAIITESSVRLPRACYTAKWLHLRGLQTTTTAPKQVTIPLRKHLKEEAKRKRAEENSNRNGQSGIRQTDRDPRLKQWELTVGIEVHAQLNTACKLFSTAAAEGGVGLPNNNVALFDAAMPGTQPSFQVAALIPAVRAALALECTVQHESSWDRKHYFHWDQPNGYQITQYYKPFAKDGRIVITAEDGVLASDLQGAESLSIGIKQIQMEQDTAKTTLHPSATYHVDINRAGHPLIEIITLPQIHSPQTAAAVVKKLQAILKSVDACVIGMELGGLRADVNVSVRRHGTEGRHGYSGIGGLGQRTEIKNLSSFKAVEDAIVAERDRQITVLEHGGMIAGETRGWTLGATETTRLRGKEGEVDYRYTPDADLPALYIGDDLVKHLQATLPELPDSTIDRVQHTYGLTSKDARTVVSLDDGDRLDFMESTAQILCSKRSSDDDMLKLGKIAGNWIIHELGGLLTISERTWAQLAITPEEMANILNYLLDKRITARSAKQLVTMLDEYDGATRPTVDHLVEDENLLLRPLDEDGYMILARSIINANPAMVSAVRDKGQRGKIMWFVGQMVRQGEAGTIEPEKARQIIEQVLEQ